MRSLSVCLRTRQALQEDTLESVMDRYVRRELVQQMYRVSSGMPGTNSGRRNMRAERVAMVQQVEAETARAQPAPSLRRKLVQQMSSATTSIPGSIGERRKMRQELEAMVHQVEAETADLGMNGGAGRIPSGFCTLTCAVYKWAQLHETGSKSYPSGPSDNPEFREYYTKWQAESPGSARESAMKKAYYESVSYTHLTLPTNREV